MAAGSGSRLLPASISTNKHLAILYDKPMIYYPLSTLMLAGIREILITTNRDYLVHFKRLLSDGSQFGIKISYIVQEHCNGVAEIFSIAEDFLKGHKIALILGDNLFHGTNLINFLAEGFNITKGA